MSCINFKFKKIRDVKTPTRGTQFSAGMDFYIPNDYKKEDLVIGPHKDILIHSGLMVDMMSQPVAFIAFNKSGKASSQLAKSRAGITMASHKGALTVGACVVDSDYQGEIMLSLINTSNHYIRLSPGEKISQLVCVPIYYVNMIETDMVFESATDRGDGKMGSTDK